MSEEMQSLRQRTMNSRAETIVPIAELENLGKAPEDPVNGGVSTVDSMKGRVMNAHSEGASSSSGPAATDGDSRTGDPGAKVVKKSSSPSTARDDRVNEFRARLVQAFSDPYTDLDQFMAKSDEYPRFVWQDFLLSFQPCKASIEERLEEERVKLTQEPAVEEDVEKEPVVEEGVEKERVGVTQEPIEEERAKVTQERVEKERVGVTQELLEEERVGATQEPVEEKTFGPYGLKKLSHIIEFYPDILQRELLRDGFQLAPKKRRADRYGALHAAVLCGRPDILYLIRYPDETQRKKICKALLTSRLTFNKVSSTSDYFNLIRRAVLWRFMLQMTPKYAKVALFMKNFENAKELKDIELLRRLIDKSTEQIDLKDASTPDPWVVLLAWASNSKWHRHISDEFKARQPQLFERILKTLKERNSSFAPFLVDEPEKEDDSLKSQGRQQLEEHPLKSQGRQQPEEHPVESIMTVLLLETNEWDRRSKISDQSNDSSNDSPMQRFFLDRMSERTPGFRWSPLHIAAARGEHEMVSILTKSCKEILDKLQEAVKKSYTRLLQESFHDAKYMTPLHYAVLGNHKEVVKTLLEWEVFTPHINDCDIFLRTALQMACSRPERVTIVDLLMKKQGIDVNTSDCCLFSSLHWAVNSGSIGALKVFEGEKRILTMERDSAGRHPYELAARLNLRMNSSEDVKLHIEARQYKDIQQVLLMSGPVKDEVTSLYRDRQMYVDASNAILVGAALIASVTFGGWLQPPLNNVHGSPQLEVRVFWACSSLSFFFSIATVMAGAAAVFPISYEYIMDSVESIRRWLVVTSLLLILSVAFVLAAFAAAGFTALSPVPELRENMKITTIIGTFVCGMVGMVFCFRLWRVRPLF